MDARSPDADVAVSNNWRPDKCDRVALVLQGGGALGAYQVGVYQALHEAGIEPDWVIGTSIGAINAALICGNEPAQRLDRLDAFWGQAGGGAAATNVRQAVHALVGVNVTPMVDRRLDAGPRHARAPQQCPLP